MTQLSYLSARREAMLDRYLALNLADQRRDSAICDLALSEELQYCCSEVYRLSEAIRLLTEPKPKTLIARVRAIFLRWSY